MMAKTEEWLPAPGASRYLVSTEGRVWSLLRRRLLTVGRHGRYGSVEVVMDDGRPRRLLVHRLVCEAFNGEPPFEGAVVRHLDGDSGNNAPGNLEWGTAKENQADAKRHGTWTRGSKIYSSKLSESRVREIRRRAAAGEKRRALAEEFGVTVTSIGYIVRREHWAWVA